MAKNVTCNTTKTETVMADQREAMSAEGVRASIHYGQREGQWVAEFRVVLISLGRANTMPITDASTGFTNKSGAIADAAARMIAAIALTTAGVVMTPAQRRAVTAVEAWADSLADAAANSSALTAAPRFLDCFAGIGGFHVALASQGAICAGAIEINAAARATYRANHPGAYPIHADICTALGTMFGEVDILCGGFPCQSFSLAGDGRGLDDPAKGALFFEVARLIEELSPTITLLENVPALVGHDGGRTFDTILDRLTRLGYAVTTALLNAADFGLPQMRERLFLLCIHDRALGNRVAPFVFPAGTDAAAVVADILEFAPAVTRCARPMARIKPDPDANSRRIELVGYIDGKCSQGYRVASPLGKGYTLCANSGGAGPKTGLYLVGGKPRTLSVREAARMQGFPEAFKPHAAPTVALRQFGNSVAVPVVSAIAGALDPSIFK